MKGLARVGLTSCAAFLSGCSGVQSALDPQGPAGEELARLIWSFAALCTIIWLMVMGVLVVALVRRRRQAADPLETDVQSEHAASRAVLMAVVATALVLVCLTVLSFFANRTLAGIGADAELTIEVTGYQWWWAVRYENSEPSRIVTTANEIHIPSGEPVRLVLKSQDVIHSFWVPALHGKLDLVPGIVNTLTLQADRTGTYRGQCAEYCGAQHAHMGVLVIAQPRVEFDAWYEAQLQNAAEPSSELARQGRDLFLNRPCVMCHKVQGTVAASNAGPDLTHVASRKTLAAGTLSMSRGNLAAWIADPQSIKPGTKMPTMNLTGDELNAIVAYVETLK